MKIWEAVKWIQETDGKIFSVKFIKRTSGEERILVGRTGVRKGLAEAPSKPGIDFDKNNLLCVWDMQAGGYRSIPVEGIKAIKVEGVWEEVTHEQQ